MRKESSFKNLSIRNKLLISHGIIVLLSIIITIVLLVGMANIKGKADGLYEKPMKNIEAIGDVRYGINDILRAMDRIIAEDKRNPEEAYEIMVADVERDVAMILPATEVLEKGLLSDEGRAILAEINQAIDEGEAIRPQVMEALKNPNSEEAYEMCFDVYLPIVEGIDTLSDELEQVIVRVADEYYFSAQTESIVLIIVGICMIVLGVAIAVYITIKMTKAIVEPVQQLKEAAEGMYQGDMSAGEKITYVSEDEIGTVAESLRGAMQTLKEYIEEISANLREIAKGDLTKDSAEITNFRGDFADIKESFVYILKRFNTTLTKIQNSSNQVASSANEISGASQVLSEGAMEQASAIEELTATIGTVASLAEKSAQSTQEATAKVRVSAEQAEFEKTKMEELTQEMEKITEISREIENIITSIEDIASQTNLLSLNASIEAARAGEAGRGFAVVADQIGKLATDSAESAVNTRELIQRTLEEIEKGNTIAASTSEAFDKIINDLKLFAEAAQETSESVTSQSAALEQIEKGIDQISEVVQNTAASSEETSAISSNLSEGAQQLDQLVNNFKLY